jgi:hypothetical protein
MAPLDRVEQLNLQHFRCIRSHRFLSHKQVETYDLYSSR